MAAVAMGSLARAVCAAGVWSFSSHTCPPSDLPWRKNISCLTPQNPCRGLNKSVGKKETDWGQSLGRQQKRAPVLAAGGNAEADVDASSLDFLDKQLGLLSDEEAVSGDGGSKFRQKSSIRPVMENAPLDASSVVGETPPPLPAPVLLEKLPISFFLGVSLALVAFTVVTNVLYNLLPQ